MKRTTVWILGDQLMEHHPALEQAADEVGRENVRVLLIESRARFQKLPYQRKKLVLLLSALRHYIAELRERGYEIDYVQGPDFMTALEQHVDGYRPDRIVTMAASSYPGRALQRGLEDRLGRPVRLLPNTQFLVDRFNPIPEPDPERRYVMESFYREMRRHFRVLMDDEKPLGGQWNLDAANRRRLPEDVAPPPAATFLPDRTTEEVMKEVAQLPTGTGSVEGFTYAVTRAEAWAAFEDFVAHRLPDFGDYQDAMTERSHVLFHALISPYLNLGLLEPLSLVRAAEEAYHRGDAPLNAVEGFIRQIIGWREFMYWQYWRQMPGMMDKNAWEAQEPLPEFLWNGDTDMACLRHAIKRAIETGYNHHIERLMLLCNFFMLTGVNPRLANDWFLSLYIDAYEWVMAPNVIGMGLNADGGLTATKPYIASANYVNKMGDHCQRCKFDHTKRQGAGACPFNYLYWNFILKHQDRLRANPRTSRNVANLRFLSDDERTAVQQQAAAFVESLRS